MMKKKGDLFLPSYKTVEIRFEMEISGRIFVHIVVYCSSSFEGKKDSRIEI